MHDDGSLHYKIRKNRACELNGSYKKYYPSGQAKKRGPLKEKGRYDDGQFDGARITYDVDGDIIGESLYKDGQLLYPHSMRFIEEKFEEISKSVAKSYDLQLRDLKLSAKERERVINSYESINRYRFICGLPGLVEVDREKIEAAYALASLVEKTQDLLAGKKNKNPGLPEDTYKLAVRHGVHFWRFEGNGWFSGGRNLIDLSMCDHFLNGDAHLDDYLAVKQDILSEDMFTTGFGVSGEYATFYHSRWNGARRNRKPFISFPAPGFMPIRLFNQHVPWCINLKDTWYKVTDKSKINLYHVNSRTLTKSGNPIEVKDERIFRPDKKARLNAVTMLMRPNELTIKKGTSYWVEVSGIEKIRKDAPDVSFLVTFY